jgi:soluble lytic murein transglycosylase-like protein
MFLGAALLPTSLLFAPAHQGHEETTVEIICAESWRQGISPKLPLFVAQRESGMNPHVKDSATGDKGMFQLSPHTVRVLRVSDPYDIHQASIAGVGLIAWGLNHCGSEEAALHFYGKGRCR